jgi:23S rRNA pseudoU1915 N3-methylase RlmH
MTSGIISNNNGKKTRNQVQEKLHETFKHIETEQCTFELLYVIERNKGGNQKIPRIKKSENTTYQNYWDRVKVMLSGNYLYVLTFKKISNK